MKRKGFLLAAIIMMIIVVTIWNFMLELEDKHPGEPRFSQSMSYSMQNNFFLDEYRPLQDSIQLSQHLVTLYFDSAFSEKQWRLDTQYGYIFSKKIPTEAYNFTFYYWHQPENIPFLFSIVLHAPGVEERASSVTYDQIRVSSNEQFKDTVWFRVMEINRDTLLRWSAPVRGELIGFVRSGIPHSKPLRDTVINYSIEGISGEGSEVKAFYINDTLKNVEWTIYGETGKTKLTYHWNRSGKILATEYYYRYQKMLADITSENDITLTDSLKYSMDSKGNLMSPITRKDFENLYPVFIKHVRLKI